MFKSWDKRQLAQLNSLTQIEFSLIGAELLSGTGFGVRLRVYGGSGRRYLLEI